MSGCNELRVSIFLRSKFTAVPPPLEKSIVYDSFPFASTICYNKLHISPIERFHAIWCSAFGGLQQAHYYWYRNNYSYLSFMSINMERQRSRTRKKEPCTLRFTACEEATPWGHRIRCLKSNQPITCSTRCSDILLGCAIYWHSFELLRCCIT